MSNTTLGHRVKRLFLALCILAFTLYWPQANIAQEPEYRIYILDDFSGGLNLKVSDFKIQPNEAIVCENVRLSENLGQLSKRTDLRKYGSADASEAITGMHRLYKKDGTKALIVTHGDEIEVGDDNAGTFSTILDLSSGDYKWSWVTWHDIAIGCDGYNPPVKYDGSSASATYLGSCLALDSGSGSGPDGTYTYKVTFYSSSYEVSLDTPSNELTVTDNDISLSMIPIGPDTLIDEDIIGRKIYRTEDGGSTYKLLSNGTIADNTTTTLTDSDADGDLGATLSPNYTYPPPKGRYPLIHKNRLWFANNPTYPSRIYYSEDASHDYFVSSNYFNVRENDGDEITAIFNLHGILTISKNYAWWMLYTERDEPDTDWEISDPFSPIGCDAPYSAVATPLGIIFLDVSGLYIFDGQYARLVSDKVSPELTNISESNYDNCWGAFSKNKYYLAYTSGTTGASVNDRIMIYDIVHKDYSIDLLDIAVFHLFSAQSDRAVLYGGSSTNGDVLSFSETVHQISHRRHEDFSGTFCNARYLPTKWGGDINDAVLEISWSCTIDEWEDTYGWGDTIDDLPGIIDRPTTEGHYVSPVLYIGATELDKLYWNETIPSAGGNVTFNIRTGATPAACQSASWSTAYSNPSGSDISGVTANDYIQYKINMATNDIDYTPNVYRSNRSYVVRLTYEKEGESYEITIPLRYESGWIDLGMPGYKKLLRKFYIYYTTDSTETLEVTFENFEGETDTFEIDLSKYDDGYTEYFTNGAFLGELFKVKLQESSLDSLQIEKIILVYTVEPLI